MSEWLWGLCAIIMHLFIFTSVILADLRIRIHFLYNYCPRLPMDTTNQASALKQSGGVSQPFTVMANTLNVVRDGPPCILLLPDWTPVCALQ